MWIGIVKLPLLRTRYFSLAGNVLRSSPKVFHVNKRDFFELNWIGSVQWIWWGYFDADFNSAWAGLPRCLSNSRLKRDFLSIYLAMFLESIISEIKKVWRSSLVSTRSKFQIDFENATKIENKLFVPEIIASELVSLNCLY